jgi:hypothetical protein
MAKPLVFQWGDREVRFEMAKVDRARLYGFKETEVLDEQGRKCELATLAQDGQTILGRGGTAFCHLSVDGEWLDKSELRPVDASGQEVVPVPSSFAAPVPLLTKATCDDYLDHAIRAVYALKSDDPIGGLLEELDAGVIYRFPFSYRGGIEPDVGFLLANSEGKPFLAVGRPSRVDFLGLAQSAGAVENEDLAEEPDDTADAMDFDML